MAYNTAITAMEDMCITVHQMNQRIGSLQEQLANANATREQELASLREQLANESATREQAIFRLEARITDLAG